MAKPTTDVEAEIYKQIAANGDVFAQWLNGQIPRDDVAVVTDLFRPDAMIVNARLPNITARRGDFEGVMTAWWGMYSSDPVRSTVELRSILDLGHERYLTVHVRRLENSTGVSPNPETTLFVRDPATGNRQAQDRGRRRMLPASGRAAPRRRYPRHRRRLHDMTNDLRLSSRESRTRMPLC